MSVRQFPKSIILCLLNYIPKLKINYVSLNYNEITIKCDIIYLDHTIPVSLNSFVKIKQDKYLTKCLLVDQIIHNIKNKILSKITLTEGVYMDGNVRNGVIVTDNHIRIGEYDYSFDCSNAIIELLEYVKLVGFAVSDSEYISKLYNIYMKYYPDSKLNGWDSDGIDNYDNDIKELFKSWQYYGYKRFDIEEYEFLCQKTKFKKYFPMYYCNRTECKLEEFNDLDCNKAIVAMEWEKSHCESNWESTDIRIVYLFQKN